MSTLKVMNSLEQGHDEFVEHGSLVGFVCLALTELGYFMLLTTMSSALTACNDQ